jgi:hypothetical protein
MDIHNRSRHESNAMKKFLQRHGEQILGVLSGFDRIRLRGALRLLQTAGGVVSWLQQRGWPLESFVDVAESMTKRLCRRTEQLAEEAGRKVIYLAEKTDKEDLVQAIRQEQGVADNGLVAVLSAVEPVASYTQYRSKTTSFLRRGMRKCKHYYFYWEDGRFGLCHVRLATWFPFDCHILLNGREWLARQLDAEGIGYLRRDNCFIGIEDFARAQRLADGQPRLPWPGQLNRLLRRAHPLHAEFFGGDAAIDYYWTSEQTEWATDVLFRDPQVLARLYPPLIRHGMETFQSPDVLRFLGHKMPAHGGVNGHYQGAVMSDLKRREEGVRIKHRAGKNTVKMYNKQPTVLRVETTLNDEQGLKAYRRKQGDMEGKPAWRKLRKSVADLPRRCKLSQAANDRYLEALATISADAPLAELTDPLCQSVMVGQRRYRGLRPFDPAEVRLLKAVSCGEFLIAGCRNRDIRMALYGGTSNPAEVRRQAARVSRQIALLRAHGLLKKIPHTHRYLLTETGVTAITAILAARDTKLNAIAA